MKRKFYKTTFTLVVLSEDEPLDNVSLDHLPELVDSGPCVLHTFNGRGTRISAKKMASLLHDSGSEPGFFNLDDHGKSTDTD